MYIDIGRVKIHLGVPAAALIALAADRVSGQVYIFAFLSMLAHEAAHIAALFYYGCKAVSLKIYPGGIKLSAERLSSLSYRQIFFCALSAPMLNAALGILALLMSQGRTETALYLFGISGLAVGAVNFIPLPFLDGGRAFAALVRQKGRDALVCDRIIDAAAVISVIFLFAVLTIMLSRGHYYFFFLFFVVYCFCELASDVGHKRG